jgi:hypothetical protein
VQAGRPPPLGRCSTGCPLVAGAKGRPTRAVYAPRRLAAAGSLLLINTSHIHLHRAGWSLVAPAHAGSDVASSSACSLVLPRADWVLPAFPLATHSYACVVQLHGGLRGPLRLLRTAPQPLGAIKCGTRCYKCPESPTQVEPTVQLADADPRAGYVVMMVDGSNSARHWLLGNVPVRVSAAGHAALSSISVSSRVSSSSAALSQPAAIRAAQGKALKVGFSSENKTAGVTVLQVRMRVRRSAAHTMIVPPHTDRHHRSRHYMCPVFCLCAAVSRPTPSRARHSRSHRLCARVRPVCLQAASPDNQVRSDQPRRSPWPMVQWLSTT